jgi:hypothetical protein
MHVSASTLQQLALEYQSLGLPAIPAFRGRPLVLWQPYQQRLPEPEEVAAWPWSKADGHRHRLRPPGAWRWLLVGPRYRAPASCRSRRLARCSTPAGAKDWSARSQRNGLHIYCLSRQPVRTTKHRWGDVKGSGSLVFAPPSKAYKPDATQDYEWLSFNPEEALQLEPADLPWPSDNGHRREPLGETLKLERTIPIGSRNTVLTRVAGWLTG